MRKLAAYGLLLLILLNWAEGCWFCLDLTWRVRRHYRMDAREAAIAASFQERFQASYIARAVKPGQQALRGFLYSNDLVVQETQAGDTVAYLLIDSNKASSLEASLELRSKLPREQQENTVLLKDFFKDFLFPTPYINRTPHILVAALCERPLSIYHAPARSLAEPPPDSLVG